MIERAQVWFHVVLSWATAHPGLVTAFGLLTLIGTAVALPVFVARLPVDYFLPTEERYSVHQNVASRVVLRGVKNLIGLVLFVCGVALLVLPGQGVLTILVGLTFLEFPGKSRLELWIVRRPRVGRAIAWLRARAGKAPLLFPPEDGEADEP